MPLGTESLRVAIAGATSLRGKDLKEWLDASGFPAGEIRLLDEEFAAGTLTNIGDEPAFVQHIDESSFERMRFVFFTGSAAFATKYGPAAARAGAAVIDLSGGLSRETGVRPWIPHLDAVLSPPPVSPLGGSLSPAEIEPNRMNFCASPSAPAIVACTLSAALKDLAPARTVITFFQPVSERGSAGVEELERQTAKLLSLQPMPQEVFDAQVAFNLLDRWGEESGERLSDIRAGIIRQIQGYLAGRAPMPAVALVQAPVFFGYAFNAYVDFAKPFDPDDLVRQLATAGFQIAGEEDPAPSNVTAAGEPQPIIGRPERDPNMESGYWFWGAADNLRIASANAVRIAERLLVS